MRRFGLLFLVLLAGPSWAQNNSNIPSLADEQPVVVPIANPPDDQPPPVSPGEAISFDPSTTTGTPQVSTPPSVASQCCHCECDTHPPPSSGAHSAPEPSTLILASIGSAIMGARARRKRRETTEE